MSTIIALDCGAPPNTTGVIIDPFNNTKFGALITFHCEEAITSMCGSDGEWVPVPQCKGMTVQQI